jgi:hypothetical protein
MLNIVRTLLVVFMLVGPVTVLAQGPSQHIGERMGSFEASAVSLVAAKMSSIMVGRYHSAFNYSDELHDADWKIVLDQLSILEEQSRRRVMDVISGRNAELKKAFIAGLESGSSTDLSQLVAFLDSPEGAEWVRANEQFTRSLSRASVVTSAYLMASRRRGEIIRATVEKQRQRGSAPSPILVVHAIQGSPGRAMPPEMVFRILDTLRAVDVSLDESARKADEALAIGIKNGLSLSAFNLLTEAFLQAVEPAKQSATPASIWDKGTAEKIDNRLKNLAERARLTADATKVGRCGLPLPIETLRVIGTDVGKIMRRETSISPGSVEHSWVAMSFERECHVKQDFSIALQTYNDMAKAGNIRVFCTLSSWYRLGVGTRPDPETANLWEERYKAESDGRPCQSMMINPQQPWAGLGS